MTDDEIVSWLTGWQREGTETAAEVLMVGAMLDDFRDNWQTARQPVLPAPNQPPLALLTLLTASEA